MLVPTTSNSSPTFSVMKALVVVTGRDEEQERRGQSGGARKEGTRADTHAESVAGGAAGRIRWRRVGWAVANYRPAGGKAAAAKDTPLG